MLYMPSAAMRPGVLGLVIAGALISTGGLAAAADLDDLPGGYRAPPPYAEPREPPPVYREGPYVEYAPLHRRRFVEEGDGCRLVRERRPDGYGREIVRRIRVCDERAERRPHEWREPRRFGYEPQLYPAPRLPYRAPPDVADDGEE